MREYRLLSLKESGKKLRDILALAALQACNSDKTQMHGSVLFSGSTVYNTGYNENRDAHWVQKPRNLDYPIRSMHAEISCMNNIPRERIVGKDLAVVRVAKSTGLLLNSEPCAQCTREMVKRSIRRCFFSLGGDLIGVYSLQKMN